MIDLVLQIACEEEKWYCQISTVVKKALSSNLAAVLVSQLC
jgi:hypothetical protein